MFIAFYRRWVYGTQLFMEPHMEPSCRNQFKSSQNNANATYTNNIPIQNKSLAECRTAPNDKSNPRIITPGFIKVLIPTQDGCAVFSSASLLEIVVN